MDRARGKRRGRGGSRGRGQDNSPNQRASPSPSPSQPQQQANSKTPVRSTPSTPTTMATPEAKIQDSRADSPAVASDSEFLTPVSSPTDLLTPDPSPEQQRQETKEPQPETPPSPTKESKNEAKVSDKTKALETPVKEEKKAEESPKESDTTLEITPEVKKPEKSVQPKVSKVETEKPEGSVQPQAEAPAEAKPVEENKAEKVVTSESGDHAKIKFKKVNLPKESAEKVQDPPKESSKVEDPPKETVKVQDPPKETAKVQDPPKETTKVQDPPKETAKVQDPPKEAAKVQDPPKESAKAQDLPKKPAKEDPKPPPGKPEAPPVAKEVKKETKTVESPQSPPVVEKPTPKRKSPPPPIEPEIHVRKISSVLSDNPTAKLVAVQSAVEKEEPEQPTKEQSAADPPAANVPTETVPSQQGQEANKEEAQPVKETVTSPTEASKISEGSGEKSQEQPKRGASGDSDDKSKSVETEKSQASVHDLQDALLTGKPGYWGGKAGLGEHTTGYESEDSLLTTGDRRSSLATGGGGGGQGWMGFTRRQVLTLLVFSVADFFSAIIISLQGPFYPREAESKGASATEYGLVFGVFELVVFITSPIYGKYLHKIGPKYVFNTGIVVTAAATIAFGFLDRIDDRTTFVALSFVVRIVEALGDAAFVTASFAIIAAEFPDSVATTFASLETFFGLGLIVGPTLGGALYEKGGFTLPFAVMGALLFGVGVFTYLLMPKIVSSTDSDKEAPKGLLDILKVPAVLLAALAIVNGSITIGFLNATLEPHIREFGLNGVLTGLVFVINGGVYAVSAPAWGWLCDRVLQPKYTGLIGVVTIFIAFLVIGPAPFIPIDTTLWIVAVGLIIHGIGLGAALVSSFVMALRESVAHGFADNIQTYGLTSALWTSSFALGAFVGPSVSGILFDYAGFRWATVFVLGCEVVMIILLSTHIATSRRRGGFSQRNLSESQPLLQSTEDPCTSKTARQKKNEGSPKEAGGYGAIGASVA